MRNLSSMMQNIKDMKDKMGALNDEMEVSRFDCSVGGGSVVAVVNGKGRVVNLRLSPEACTKENADILAEMIQLAINNAHSDAERKKDEALKKITGGLSLPPGMTLPF